MASALTLALLTSLAAPALASISLCKCTCRIPGGEPAGNTTIVPLYLPKDPDFPCLSCSRQFCLDQKLASCVGATDEQDFEARCFQRDSPKSHVLVVLFIIVTSVLLVGAAFKTAGIDLGQTYREHGLRGISAAISERVQRRKRGPAAHYAPMSST